MNEQRRRNVASHDGREKVTNTQIRAIREVRHEYGVPKSLLGRIAGILTRVTHLLRGERAEAGGPIGEDRQ